MGKIKYGVLNPTAKLVPDADYASQLHSLIAHARRRCLCSLFIVDIMPLQTQKSLVDPVLVEMQAARWRGVDARLIIGGSWTNLAIARTAEAARARAYDLNIPCRWLTYKEGKQSHAKIVIVDDYVMIGSHNWTTGAFTDQTQDSIIVKSQSLAAYLIPVFEYQWYSTKERSPDV